MICWLKKMGIIYGSSTGTYVSLAQTIAEKLGVASVDVIDASKITTEKVGDVYKRQPLLFGYL